MARKKKATKNDDLERIVIRIPKEHAMVLQLVAMKRERPEGKWARMVPARVVEQLVVDALPALKKEVKSLLATLS